MPVISVALHHAVATSSVKFILAKPFTCFPGPASARVASSGQPVAHASAVRPRADRPLPSAQRICRGCRYAEARDDLVVHDDAIPDPPGGAGGIRRTESIPISY